MSAHAALVLGLILGFGLGWTLGYKVGMFMSRVGAARRVWKAGRR